MNFVTTSMLIVLPAAMTFGPPADAVFQQHAATVTWHIQYERMDTDTIMLQMTAQIPQGWLLYSQYLPPGGPTPTTFTFHADDSYCVTGALIEEGEPDIYYDELYEMEITSYSGDVRFSIPIKLKTEKATISGQVNYLLCNSAQCIAKSYKFGIVVN